MKYTLDIKECNQRAHRDIEADLEFKQDGLVTFILRVNNGIIVDYNVMEYIDWKKYDGLEQSIIEELTAAYHSEQGSGGDPIRTDNSERRSQGRSSKTQNA
jgi:hypothetical protein